MYTVYCSIFLLYVGFYLTYRQKVEYEDTSICDIFNSPMTV